MQRHVGTAVSQILSILGLHAEEELELKFGDGGSGGGDVGGSFGDYYYCVRMHEHVVTMRSGQLLKRATQAAITALWANFQQLKFGSSKVVPKDGTLTTQILTHPEPSIPLIRSQPLCMK